MSEQYPFMVSAMTKSKDAQSDTTTANINNDKQSTDASASNTSGDGINSIINWIQQ